MNMSSITNFNRSTTLTGNLLPHELKWDDTGLMTNLGSSKMILRFLGTNNNYAFFNNNILFDTILDEDRPMLYDLSVFVDGLKARLRTTYRGARSEWIQRFVQA